MMRFIWWTHTALFLCLSGSASCQDSDDQLTTTTITQTTTVRSTFTIEQGYCTAPESLDFCGAVLDRWAINGGAIGSMSSSGSDIGGTTTSSDLSETRKFQLVHTYKPTWHE